MNDQRREPRLEISVDFEAAWDGETRDVHSLDVTESGALLAWPQENDRPPVGSELTLTPTDAWAAPERSASRAVVVRHTDTGVAVRFVAPEPAGAEE